MVTTENVFLGVLLNVVLLECVRPKSFGSQEFTVKSGLPSIYFELKPIASIKKLKAYSMGRPTSNRHRNIWDMNEGYRGSACRAALAQKDSKLKSSIFNPFDDGSAGVYLIDGLYETIAYRCPSVPPLFLEGRVDMDTNRAHIVVLFQDYYHHHRPSTSEDRYDLSVTSGSPQSPNARHSFSGSSYSPPNSKSISPPSSPYPTSRYGWSGSAFSPPYAQPRYRDTPHKPASAPKYREIPSKPTSYSPLPTASRLPSRFSSGNSSPSAHSQPAKRRFGLGQFIIRLVS